MKSVVRLGKAILNNGRTVNFDGYDLRIGRDNPKFTQDKFIYLGSGRIMELGGIKRTRPYLYSFWRKR